MAVAVIIDFPDGNAQKYEQVTGKHRGGQGDWTRTPAGRRYRK